MAAIASAQADEYARAVCIQRHWRGVKGRQHFEEELDKQLQAEEVAHNDAQRRNSAVVDGGGTATPAQRQPHTCATVIQRHWRGTRGRLRFEAELD